MTRILTRAACLLLISTPTCSTSTSQSDTPGAPSAPSTILLQTIVTRIQRRSSSLQPALGQYTDMGAMITRALEINGTRNGFNGAPPAKLTTTDGRIIEFFAAHQPGDEQRRQGQPVDLLVVDEAAQFLWSQIQLMMGWVRSTDPNQRCRTLLASNPPLSSEGLWMVEEFAPWLDPSHPTPAAPGELRWYISDEHGKSVEVDTPEPREVDGHMVTPQSRTFIPAGLKDNPFLSRTQYKQQLDNLPAERGRRSVTATSPRCARTTWPRSSRVSGSTPRSAAGSPYRRPVCRCAPWGWTWLPAVRTTPCWP